VAVVRPYLSALRTRDGKLQLLPGVLDEQRKPTSGGSVLPVRIARIVLEDGVVELFDATVAQPPLKLRLEQIRAAVEDIALPAVSGRTRFDLAGLVKGGRRDGRLRVTGWLEAAPKNSWVKTELRGADLVALQPYLTRASDARLQRGTLDLDLTSEVRANRLSAPGKAVLAELEFAPATNGAGTFLGVPRAAVVKLLQDKDGRIAVNFVIEGDLNNPQFTLREALATRLTVGLAEHLGLSVRGVAEGVGSLGRKGVEAAGRALQGLFR
jgi:hypothetical protein